MGATIQHWSDRTPATIVKITPSGKTITLQEDKAIRLDKNGMSDVQEYSYEADPTGFQYVARQRSNGNYYLIGSKTLVSVGIRRKFHDYSF